MVLDEDLHALSESIISLRRGDRIQKIHDIEVRQDANEKCSLLV